MKKSMKAMNVSTPKLIGCVVILLAIGLSPYFYAWAKSFVNNTRIPRGIMVGSIDASMMNEDQLRNALEDFQQHISQYGVTASFNGASATLHGSKPLQADLPLKDSSIAFIDIDSTIRNAFAVWHSPSLLGAITIRTRLYFTQQRVPLSVSINRDLFAQSLKASFPHAQSEVRQADLTYNTAAQRFDVLPEQSGFVFDIDSATQSLSNNIGAGISAVTVHIIEQKPKIVRTNIEPLKEKALAALHSLTLVADEQHTWTRDPSSIAGWITVTENEDGKAILSPRKNAIQEYLEKTVAPAVFIESKDPRFEMKNGKILITTKPQQGRKLDTAQSVELIANAILDSSMPSVQLLINDYAPAQLSIPSHDSIKEMVAQATTDFKGSPKNRKANIANGVARINGILIQPSEEFSLLRHLVPIDDTNGFLPELVIKGNATKPEFGGGLCQVSTTLFRAVAFAGLPVSQRRNHSYRVSYYEPPVGFDATIYSPNPDFRFKNDMATPLLLQADIKGTKLTVTFWGMKDGRISEVDKPTVYNIKKPPATKIIETTELKPGEKKCTEKAHAGADAYFERRVTYPSGEVKKDLFKSHYIVWPAVCYVGKEEGEKKTDTLELAPLVN